VHWIGRWFLGINEEPRKDEIQVKFPGSLKTGFNLTIANCALFVLAGTIFKNRSTRPVYGHAAWELYAQTSREI